jgi:hypothetical protein
MLLGNYSQKPLIPGFDVRSTPTSGLYEMASDQTLPGSTVASHTTGNSGSFHHGNAWQLPSDQRVGYCPTSVDRQAIAASIFWATSATAVYGSIGTESNRFFSQGRRPRRRLFPLSLLHNLNSRGTSPLLRRLAPTRFLMAWTLEKGVI